MGSRLLATALVATAVALTDGGAAAAQGPFGPQTELGGATSSWPSIAMTSRGDAVVAWDRYREGVWLAWRPAGGGPWHGPALIFEGPAAGSTLAMNDRGAVAVAWHDGPISPDPAVPTPQGIRFRLFTAGGTWGPIETVPQPPVEPNRTGHAEDRRIYNSHAKVAVAADGAAAVGWLRQDDGTETWRYVVAVRPPGGSFGPAQTLSDDANGHRELEADGRGAIVASWSRPDRPGSADRATGIYVAERARGAASFGAEQRLASTDAYDSRAELTLNRRGDGLLVWYDGVASRVEGGPWSAPERLAAVDLNRAALNERGDAIAIAASSELFAQFRPAGGAFGPVAVRRDEQSGDQWNAAALDAFGTAVIVENVHSPRRLTGIRRFRDGPFMEPITITRPGPDVYGQTMATDAFGNGVIAYIADRPRPAYGAIEAVDYSATPPTLTDVAALPRTAFRFRLSEPARVKLTLWRGRTALGTVRMRAGAGRGRIVAPASLRRRLRRGGSYVARLRARDGGRRASRPVRVRFRAR